MPFEPLATALPDYYLVTVRDITNPQNEQTIFEGEKLDGSKLSVNYKEDKRYLLIVTGIWGKIGLFGQQSDSVAYAYLISVTK